MLYHAPCKINLTLDVSDRNQRHDGYHNLDSFVLPFCSLSDKLYIDIHPSTDQFSINLTCNDSSLPTDSQNLVHRAAEAYLLKTKQFCQVNIDLHKLIPKQAGLGGGSSDAAIVLMALNSYFDDLLRQDELSKIASQIGSDVALFLAKKPVRMRGYGELIESIDIELPAIWGVIVHPGTGVSTPRAYALLDTVTNRKPGTNTESLLIQLYREKNDLNLMFEAIKNNMSNDFEDVILSNYPEVARAYRMMDEVGSLKTLLCGSGSAVFGLARDREHAHALMNSLSDYFPFVTLVTNTN